VSSMLVRARQNGAVTGHPAGRRGSRLAGRRAPQRISAFAGRLVGLVFITPLVDPLVRGQPWRPTAVCGVACSPAAIEPDKPDATYHYRRGNPSRIGTSPPPRPSPRTQPGPIGAAARPCLHLGIGSRDGGDQRDVGVTAGFGDRREVSWRPDPERDGVVAAWWHHISIDAAFARTPRLAASLFRWRRATTRRPWIRSQPEQTSPRATVFNHFPKKERTAPTQRRNCLFR
jgi:hypothetical protein